jgi:hypothetical protein
LIDLMIELNILTVSLSLVRAYSHRCVKRSDRKASTTCVSVLHSNSVFGAPPKGSSLLSILTWVSCGRGCGAGALPESESAPEDRDCEEHRNHRCPDHRRTSRWWAGQKSSQVSLSTCFPAQPAGTGIESERSMRRSGTCRESWVMTRSTRSHSPHCI